MSLPFFRPGPSCPAPTPLRLWSVKLGAPILACVLREWECLWVHFVPDRQRTALHLPTDCPFCKAGGQAQKRAYAPALLMRGIQPGTLSPVRWGNIWSPGILELPGDAFAAVLPGWPAVWLCERLDRRNGVVRVHRDKPHVPLPTVTKLWEIEPTLRRVFGMPSMSEGGVL